MQAVPPEVCLLPLLAEYTVSTSFLVVALLAIVAQALVLARALFYGGPRYKISSPRPEALDSDEFLYMLEALADAKVNHENELEVLTNGENFYEAELAAIRGARRSVNLEAYIFQKGEIAQHFVEALTERAQAGVHVNVVLDALGSLATPESYFDEFKNAGGKFAWYHAVRWHSLSRYNHRTHRELLVVDGEVGFVGGAGIADHWLKSKGKEVRWRDTMVRVEGDAVPNLQATFCENWLEAFGELLTGPDYFPICNTKDKSTIALVINSTPSAGGSTRARILFQTLLASARKTIYITTPYFLPDGSAISELIKAMRERGVRVKVLVPGAKSDHLLTRSSSRRAYGRLLQSGAEILEYQPAMIHAKVLTIDGLWSVIGSTNFDNRSFGLNDEVNVAVRDKSFTRRLEEDFARDLANSRAISLEEWRRRPLFERAPELLGRVLERQQ